MTRDELTVRLRTIRARAAKALDLLRTKPLNAAAQEEVRELAGWLKNELESEYKRMVPERVQRSMTMFELSVYSPTIQETWTESGISRLRIDGSLTQRWQEVMEAVCYKMTRYLD